MSASNFRIGSGELSIDGQSVGLLAQEGMIVSYEPKVHLHMSAKYGETPVKASIVGQTLKLVATMGEHTFDNMEAAFAGVVQADGKLKFGGVAGREVVGKQLVLTPFDGTAKWTFRNAVPTSNIETAYSPTGERLIKVEFTAMVDETVNVDDNTAYAS